MKLNNDTKVSLLGEKKTDFGNQSLSFSEKVKRVDAVFESVAPQYDIMNDMMSLGMHRLWKFFMIAISQIQPASRVLDLATGTGDIAKRLYPKLGATGQLTLLDRNSKMLNLARDRLINRGFTKNITFVQASAEALPFQDNTFDHITIAFGLRNITYKKEALLEMHRILKPAGQLMVLEFSKPISPFLNKLYNFYSIHWIPRLGNWIAKDKASYQYLIESIQRHPDANTLRNEILNIGFSKCDYHQLSLGIVALHRAWKA